MERIRRTHGASPIRRLAADQRGNVATLLALAVIPLFVTMGLAVDGSRGYLVKSKLQDALDTAGLAGGRVLDSDNARADIDMFFAQNYPADYLGGEVDAFDVVIDDSARTITLGATVILPTAFMGVAGVDTMTVNARSVIQRADSGLELALVLDDTGSMQAAGKIGALKDAAHELVGILYGSADTVDELYVAVVPYRGAVNVGDGHTGWLTGYDPADFAPDTWQGCVEARSAPYDQDDTPPTDERFTALLWPSGPGNPWPPLSGPKGPNRGCPETEILPLTADRSTVETRIDALDAAGGSGTLTGTGLIWGWRVISPRWRSDWGDASLPLDYDEPNMRKAVVFLTDGLTNFSPSGYTAYGFLSDGRLGTTNKHAAEAELEQRLATMCTAMKNEGIEIFTIMLKLNDADLENLYRNCASSSSNFFNSPTNDDLRQAFRAIGGRLTELRIAQ